MPKELKNCVQNLEDKGMDSSEAYAICSKSTGWIRKKGGGWINKKTGEVFNEHFEKIGYLSFKRLFKESAEETLKWLKNTKEIRKEVQRLKDLFGKIPPEQEKELINLIKWLEDRIKG